MFLKQIKDKYSDFVLIKDLQSQEGEWKICRVVFGMKLFTRTLTLYDRHGLRVKLLWLQSFKCSKDKALHFNSFPVRHCASSSSCSKGNEVTAHHNTTPSLITAFKPSPNTIQLCALWMSGFCSYLWKRRTCPRCSHRRRLSWLADLSRTRWWAWDSLALRYCLWPSKTNDPKRDRWQRSQPNCQEKRSQCSSTETQPIRMSDTH